MSIDLKVYFDRGHPGPHGPLQIGPLGCFDLQDEVELRGGVWVVVGVELDGMATVLPRERIGAKFRFDCSLASVLKGLDQGEASGPSIFTKRSEWMAAKIRAEREKHGLPPVELDVAA